MADADADPSVHGRAARRGPAAAGRSIPTSAGALLPVLHLAQDTFGYVSLEVEEYVAGLFELSPAHVHEVVTFYTLFFQQPVGRHVVAVCHNLSCYLLGAKGILDHLKERLGRRGRARRPPTAGSRC